MSTCTRYLQLRDDLADEGGSFNARHLTRLRPTVPGRARLRGTQPRLRALRAVDHHLRLIVSKVAALPTVDYPAFREVATRLGFATASSFDETLRERMRAVRKAYDRITSRSEPPA